MSKIRFLDPELFNFMGSMSPDVQNVIVNHDYDFQYFFFTEVSRGASRILFLVLAFYTTGVKKQ